MADDLKDAIQSVINGPERYNKEIKAGEQRINEIRKYLEEMDVLPSISDQTEIGSRNAVQTFSSFDDWLGSFSATEESSEADKIHLADLKLQKLGKFEKVPLVIC